MKNQVERNAVNSMLYMFIRTAVCSDDFTFNDEINYWIDSINEETSTELLDFMHGVLTEEIDALRETRTVEQIDSCVQEFLGAQYEDVFLYGMVSRVLLESQLADEENL